MTAFEHALILILLLTALSIVGRWLPWPMPVTYVVGASAAALWLGFPRVELNPEFFFLCFVPPLLFSDGWLMPLRDFMASKRSIITLAVGLVIFTTVCVGLVAHWLVPNLPLAMAFALGAVISPTDAVAVGAITSRLKVPARLTAVLNGESLMNDATGLVAFKFALAALAVGTFSIRAAAVNFLVLAAGGVAIGLGLGYLVGKIRDLLRHVRSSDTYIEVTLSLMTPYAAYLLGEALHLSSILAVVTAGLYSGWRDPLRMDVAARQANWSVWAMVLFWLNGMAFVLLGLQFPALLAKVSESYSPLQIVMFTAVISGTAILTRLAWVFLSAYLSFRLFPQRDRREKPPSRAMVLVTGWAGMRGAITLAAALSIPQLTDDGRPFPARDLVIFLSLGVILVTLLLQGTTLEWLICRLGLRADESRQKEDRLARLAAVKSGLASLRQPETDPATPEERTVLGLIIAEYEHRLLELTAEGETKAVSQRHLVAGRLHRLRALEAERTAIDDLWTRDVITDEIHRPLQQLLDHEEALLRAQPGGPPPA